jgi:PAS domain S-box-containing protein
MDTNSSDTNYIGVKVADHVSAMLAYWDKNQICRFANGAYLEWFGKTREEMVNKMTCRDLLGPSLYEKNLPYISGALEGKVQTFEREIILPSGEIRPALANYYPDILNGEVLGFFVHVADVTPLKKLEKKLVKSNETVSAQNKRLLNFSNIVSHNLKSYSVNLSAILELYTAAESESEKEKMLKYLKNISRGFSATIDHLNEIVKSQNQSQLNYLEINLQSYIKMVVEHLRIQISSSNAVVINNVSPEVMLSVNPAYMESILLNLLTNAIKYRHPERTPVIELESFHEDDKTALVIKDNGKGINLEKHGADLFGMYKTFHGNADAQGIGLFITKYQIEAMGGIIKVESEENRGASFTIYFDSYKV